MSLSWLSDIPWDWEPSVVGGCAVLAGLYIWMQLRTGNSGAIAWLRAAAFAVGDGVLLVALVSPLDTLADHYLFSAHMVQHLLLIELAAPLLLLSIRGEWWAAWLHNRVVAAWEKQLRRPGLAWGIGFGTVAFWHIPFFYNLTLRILPVHVFEHLCFLASAVVFWWPVLSPRDESRMPALESILYLFSRMVANLLLGTLVAIVPLGTYAYVHAATAPIPWHLSRLTDQRLGGYLMWVPALAIDMCALPLLLALWFGHEEDVKARRLVDAAAHPELPLL